MPSTRLGALCGADTGIPNNRAMNFVQTCLPSDVLRRGISIRARWAVTLAAISTCLLAACNPAMNWRDIAIPDSTLRAMLPCDPKTLTRTQDKGPAPGMGPVQFSATGCKAQESTYAVSHFLVAQPERAGEVLGYWQATVQQLARDSTAGTGTGGATAFVPMKALNLPQSLRSSFQLQGADGATQPVQGAWFARVEPGGVRLYSALIYGGSPSTEQQQMFFEGLRLQ